MVWWSGTVQISLLLTITTAGHDVLRVRHDLTSGYPNELLFHPLAGLTPAQTEWLRDMMPSLREISIPATPYPLLRIVGHDRVMLALFDRIESRPYQAD